MIPQFKITAYACNKGHIHVLLTGNCASGAITFTTFDEFMAFVIAMQLEGPNLSKPSTTFEIDLNLETGVKVDQPSTPLPEAFKDCLKDIKLPGEGGEKTG